MGPEVWLAQGVQVSVGLRREDGVDELPGTFGIRIADFFGCRAWFDRELLVRSTLPCRHGYLAGAIDLQPLVAQPFLFRPGRVGLALSDLSGAAEAASVESAYGLIAQFRAFAQNPFDGLSLRGRSRYGLWSMVYGLWSMVYG